MRRLRVLIGILYDIYAEYCYYEGESNENLKSVIKIRTTARLTLSFNNDTHGLKSGRQVLVR